MATQRQPNIRLSTANSADISRQIEVSEESKKDKLLHWFLKTGSFHASAKPEFPLSSGKLSRYYVDCKVALSHAAARELVAALILEKVDLNEIDAVGGLELGAYPIGLAVSDVAHRVHDKDLSAFIIRKQPKGHGLKKYVEGDVTRGDRVLIVDDVITSGQSTVTGIERSKESGLVVVKAVGVIDREEDNGAGNVRAAGVEFDAVLTLRDLDGYAGGSACTEASGS